MKRTDGLLSSFDESWKEFSDAWKKARAKASEKSIHHLRVSTRRLIATLELTRALSRQNEIPKVQRRFNKVLKGMGPLRDLQVQIERVSKMRQAGPIVEFKRLLERRERRQIDRVGKELKRGAKRRLTKGVNDVRSEFVRLHEKFAETKIRQSVERALNRRLNEFHKARKRFQLSDDETLHPMRIALKKLRYIVEAAQPVLGAAAKARAREMQRLQQLLGDTRDIELLCAELEKWAAKRGNKVAIVPALERLREKREGLMQEIVKSAAALDQNLSADNVKPAVETTHAVAHVLATHPSEVS